MEKYYYNDGFREFGPFEMPELLHQKIRADFKIREENESKWQRADQHEHFKSLFASTSLPVTAQQREPVDHSYTPVKRKPVHWRDIVLFVTLLMSLVLIVLRYFIDLFMNKLGIYPEGGVYVVFRILYLFLPFGMATGLRYKTLRIIGYVVAVILALQNLYAAFTVYSHM